MRTVVENIDVVLNGEALAEGLTRVQMKGLGGTVIVAGANGSGKSRLLRFVQNFATAQFIREQGLQRKCAQGFRGVDGSGSDIQLILVPTPNNIQVHAAATATDGDKITARETFINQASQFSNSLPFAIRTVQALANEFIDTGNALLNLEMSEAAARKHRWEQLNQLIDSLLSRKIQFDKTRQLYVDKVQIDEAYRRFSDGQKRLFQFAVALAGTSKPGLKQLVIFDEPETSLHPQAAIAMIKRMQEVIDGQLWIATHSVPLIAALGIENVWYASEGSISYGGRRTERVINSLIGGADNLLSLRSVLAEPDKLALARFAAECLRQPGVVGEAAPDDPQMNQAIDATQSVGSGTPGSQKVRLLDWGCGQARLKVWLEQYKHQHGAQIDYWGYEPEKATAEKAARNIEKLTSAPANIYSDLKNMFSQSESAEGFDVVVLANVLHEIEPMRWLETFNSIAEVLSRDGKVLILEDKLLPVGELPHLTGFLLLDLEACADLFTTTEDQLTLLHSAEERWRERLIGFTIPKHILRGINSESVRSCLQRMSERMLLKIGEYRNAAQGTERVADYNSGHLHALAVMQFANARLALEKLE